MSSAKAGPMTITAAVVQMTSGADPERNLARAEELVGEAVAAGAGLVGLPENFAFLRSDGEAGAVGQSLDGPWIHRMSALAERLEITLLLGSIPEKVEGETRVHNTSILLGPDGGAIGFYRKMHIFDVDLPGMEHLKESKSVLEPTSRLSRRRTGSPPPLLSARAPRAKSTRTLRIT